MPEKDQVNKDLVASFAIPTAIANRFVLTVGPNGLRLCFGEAGVPGQEPQWRSAVFLSREDAADLNKALTGLLKQVAN